MALAETQVVANEIEKVKAKGVLPAMFDRDNVFFSNVERREVEVISARDMRIPLELRPGGLFGHFDPAGGDLGRGEGPTFDKATIGCVFFKHAIEWHKKAQWATDDKRKAVVNTFRHLMSKSMAEFRRQLDSVCKTGGNGVVGVISNVAGGGPYTLTLGTDGFGTRLVRYGQKVNVYSANLATNRTTGAERSITAIDSEAKTITISGGAIAGIVAGDKIVLSGLDGASPVSLFGLPYHHSNASAGTWLGFDRSLTPEIRANRVAAGGSLALAHPRIALNKIGDRLGINEMFKVTAWMHPCQVQAYEELGQLAVVINKEAKEQGLDLYFNDNMRLAGAPIKKDFGWDKTRIDFVVNEVWGRAEILPIGFYEEEGRKLFELRGASGGVAAATIFYLVYGFNLFVTQPPACSYIDTLSVPSGY